MAQDGAPLPPSPRQIRSDTASLDKRIAIPTERVVPRMPAPWDDVKTGSSDAPEVSVLTRYRRPFTRRS